jgi:endonuclease YncB( thermonuclease family)
VDPVQRARQQSHEVALSAVQPFQTLNRSRAMKPPARIAAAALLAFLAASAFADIEGSVVGVSDGDTVTVLDEARTQHKIRLAGIDAPEKAQAFGNKSKQALSDCAFGRRARVTGSKLDRYGRLVAKVIVEGVDCNLRQVQLGLAWHYKAYAREQSAEDRAAYSQAELAGREQRLGLWRDNEPEPPWDFRRARR